MEILKKRQIMINLYYEALLYLVMSNNLSNYRSSYSSLILFLFYLRFIPIKW